VGVSAITFGVLEKHHVNVPIVPVGLNYFRGHRFRGRVVVEFGEPIQVTSSLHDLYKQSKRTAYTTLLTQVEDGMRSVIITAPNYEELKLIHTARRLYQKASVRMMSTKQRQDLARRFASAYRLLKERFGEDLPDDLRDLQQRVERYQEHLDELGLRDYQVVSNQEMDFSRMLFIFMHGAFILALASVPSIILNAPVGFAASYWSFQQAQKDLKASRVKVAARDVMLSKKIVFSFVAVPVLWLTYALLLVMFTKLQLRTIIVILLCCPIFSYCGVMAVEIGMIDLKDLRPAFLRLLPGFREKAQELYNIRQELQKDVREAVKKYGPSFGPLYYEKTSAWEQTIRKSRSNPLLSDMSQPAVATAYASSSASATAPAVVSKKDD
jgi:glycerol-3-phosphate O-acyltransferase / dihydroxyacetone phosphate acyltransferase